MTGAEVEVDLENNVLTDIASGRTFELKPLGEVRTSNYPCLEGLYSNYTLTPIIEPILQVVE